MNAEERLKIVRELSEGATLRPAPRQLRTVTVEAQEAEQRAKPAPYAMEEFMPIHIGSGPGMASGYKPRRPKEGTSNSEHSTPNLEGEAA